MHLCWIYEHSNDYSRLEQTYEKPVLCFRALFTNEVLVFDKNVDGLVHYLEILSDDIFYYSWQKLVMAAGPSFINISPYTETDWIQTENLSQQSALQNILRSKTY